MWFDLFKGRKKQSALTASEMRQSLIRIALVMYRLNEATYEQYIKADKRITSMQDAQVKQMYSTLKKHLGVGSS
jgi:hypothetical protein